MLDRVYKKNLSFNNMGEKQKIISDIYFDRAGYGSLKTTLADARDKDKTIKMEDVKEFFKKNVEEKRKPRGENSFVAPRSFWEYQLDLFFISKNDLEHQQKFRVGLVLIDIFTKYAVVIPIKSKQPPDVLAGMMEGMNKMGKKPKMIYSDEEGSLNSDVITSYLDEEKIEIHRTRGHPAFAERFIRTFKDKLYKRIANDEKKGKADIQWIDYITEIMLTYNTKDVHSATGLTPKEARQPRNDAKAKISMTIKARKSRMYPEIRVNDNVKIMRKKAITEKANTSHWLKEIFRVERIEKKLGQEYYFVEGRDKGLLRHELLKV